jgi:hypothetical protein
MRGASRSASSASCPAHPRLALPFGLPGGLVLLAMSAVAVGVIAHTIWRMWS